MKWRQWLFAPQPVARVELVRALAPLAILGFLSSRLAHADFWIGDAGFHLAARADDWRQPLYLAPLPAWAAWAVAALIVVAGLALAAGAWTRVSAGVFAVCLAYTALADRLQAFTVSKLAPMIALALCLGPAGARYSVDQWRRRRRDPAAQAPSQVSGGSVRFFQLFLVVMYSGSGLAKLRGDWLAQPVLFTHLHDSYQTALTFWLARALPAWAWMALQWATLIFEVGAPLWFALRPTRRLALWAGLTMHLFIGVMFGPVIWFAALMSVLLVASFARLSAAPERAN